MQWCTANLSVLLRADGHLEEALELSGSTLRGLLSNDQISEGHFLTYAVAINHANNLVAVGEIEQAAELDEQSDSDLVSFYGATYPDVEVARRNLLDSRRRQQASGDDRTAGHLERSAVPIEMPVL